MVDLVDSEDLARRAELIYAGKLRTDLERDHRHEFVAIEPDSGDFYLGKTLTEAMGKSREAHPGCLALILRVGHVATIHMGLMAISQLFPISFGGRQHGRACRFP